MWNNSEGKKHIDIESYAKTGVQYYGADIPPILKKYLTCNNYESLLDCGCGDGVTMYALKNQGFLTTKNVFAIDLSVSRIEMIKKIDSNIKAFVDNVETMETIKSDSIDFLISEQVIEHVDQVKMLNSIDRVIKSHGIVYLSTVFKKWYGWYFYRNNGRWVLDPTHLREYEKDSELFDHIDMTKFVVLENKKRLIFYPVIDFLIKKIKIKNKTIFNNKFLKIIRQIKRPVLGYYYWEIVLKKK